MIRLHTLGRIDLAADNDCGADALVAQPKRFALLCYLTFPKPGTMFRRDTLLDVFWPEGDSEHTRTALRQALARIRKSLGSDVILRRGSEEVGLNPDRFWCDVAAFEQTLDEGKWAEATELYRGELLKGFYIGKAPEFEQWLETERARLAGRYAMALEELATAATAAGKMRAAVEWWQSLTLHDPYDSRLAMGLMEALDRAGDPGNALLHARKHIELLREELEIGPPTEFEGLVERIRVSPQHEVSAVQTWNEVTPAEPVVLGTQTDAMRETNPRRKRMMVATGCLVLFVAITGAMFTTLGNRISLEADQVVVAVFRNATGDPAFDLLGERAAHWVTQGLQQAEMQVSSWDETYRAWEYVEAESNEGRSRNPVRALAEETGAGTVISGSIYMPEEGCLEIVASVTDARRERLIGTLDPVSGPVDSATVLLGQLRQRIAGFLALRSDDQRAAPFELAGDPPTYDAYTELRAGMKYFVRTEMIPAEPHFRRAVELDSTFAEALFFLAVTLWNMHEYHSLDSVLDVAQRHEHRFTPYYRNQIEYVRALSDGDLEQSRLSARRAAEMASGSRAAFAFAAICYFTNRPFETIRELTALDPERGAMRDWVGYSGFLTEAFFMAGDHEAELEAARHARLLYPEHLHWTLSREALALAAMGRVDEIDGVLVRAHADLETKDTSPVVERSRQAPVEVVEVLRRHGYSTAAQRVLRFAIVSLEARPPRIAATHHHRLWYARALFLESRYDEARRVLDALVEEFPNDVRVRGTRAFIAAAVGNSTQAMQDARWLEELDRPFLFGEHSYWRGVIAAWSGEPENAVMLLQRAHDQGRRYHWYDMVSTDLDPLRNFGPFKDWMRPKG